ncbi:MAG: CCE_0567 family metalloprotein [Spirulina sp.]
MVQTLSEKPTPEAIAELKTKIKKLNSKAGQMKMDLHDLAEGLPTDYQKLPEEAEKTYQIYCQLAELKKQLKAWEKA